MGERELSPGQIQSHTSEEGGPPDVGMLLQIDADNALWIGEISRDLWEQAGTAASELGSDFGWWIVHFGKSGARVLGKCVGAWPELDTDFIDILAAAIRRASPPDAGARPHAFTGNAPGVINADNCQICGRWFDEPETEMCRSPLAAPEPPDADHHPIEHGFESSAPEQE